MRWFSCPFSDFHVSRITFHCRSLDGECIISGKLAPLVNSSEKVGFHYEYVSWTLDRWIGCVHFVFRDFARHSLDRYLRCFDCQPTGIQRFLLNLWKLLRVLSLLFSQDYGPMWIPKAKVNRFSIESSSSLTSCWFIWGITPYRHFSAYLLCFPSSVIIGGGHIPNWRCCCYPRFSWFCRSISSAINWTEMSCWQHKISFCLKRISLTIQPA